MNVAIATAIDRLANGNFVLLEYLTARALAVNVERLRRRGERAHAEARALAWKHANGGATR